MAPTMLENLFKRAYTCDYYGYNCYYTTSWDAWGRWVLIAGIVVFILFISFILVAIRSRRRRRLGLRPYYGTGWVAGRGPAPNNPNYYNQGPPAPPYTAPMNNQYTGTTFNSNAGYYGQSRGIELEQPKNTYNVR